MKRKKKRKYEKPKMEVTKLETFRFSCFQKSYMGCGLTRANKKVSADR